MAFNFLNQWLNIRNAAIRIIIGEPVKSGYIDAGNLGQPPQLRVAIFIFNFPHCLDNFNNYVFALAHYKKVNKISHWLWVENGVASRTD